jgi:hypothetical protein
LPTGTFARLVFNGVRPCVANAFNINTTLADLHRKLCMRSLRLKETGTKSVTFIRRLFPQFGDDEVAVENAPGWHAFNYALDRFF